MSTLSLTYYKTFDVSLSLSRPCFPCEEWRYRRRQSLNLVTFIILIITHSSETDVWLGATYLTPVIDHQGQSHPSFPSLMKKKSCFLFPKHKNRNQSMFPQKSLSSKNDTITVWNSSDFPMLQILYHIPDTPTTPTTISSSPSTTLKPSKVNFCLSSPLYFLLEGSMRNIIPFLRMESRKAL